MIHKAIIKWLELILFIFEFIANGLAFKGGKDPYKKSAKEQIIFLYTIYSSAYIEYRK